jgi:16S rRNA (cytosine967-C5)-methyltransferase
VDAEYDPITGIEDSTERLAVETSHPSWLIDRWVHAFGLEEADAFARANNAAAPVAFRVVSNRAVETAVLNQLENAGAEIAPSMVAKHAWRITGGGQTLADMASAGKVYIQDEASQLLTTVLDPRVGERVLDLCAAPGSKTTHIADVTRDSAIVVAGDLYEHRLRTVSASAQLQAFNRVNCVQLDGLQPLPFPEIRWRISTRDIEDLAARQKQLLINASRTVKIGGRLVYSTCSVETEENENVRQWFIENSNNFRQVKLELDASLVSAYGDVRTWPHRQGSDGFFMCAFERLN